MKTSSKQTNKKTVTEGEKKMSKAIKQKEINIDEQPDYRCCYCCGRHISELTPYGEPGDQAAFAGASLVRNYRPFAPFDEVVEKKLKEAYRCCDNGHGNAEKWLIKKWGEKETERLFFIEAAYNQIETSYECRDCIILSTEEYYEKIHERFYSKKDN